jgi:hypothetical protein
MVEREGFGIHHRYAFHGREPQLSVVRLASVASALTASHSLVAVIMGDVDGMGRSEVFGATLPRAAQGSGVVRQLIQLASFRPE